MLQDTVQLFLYTRPTHTHAHTHHSTWQGQREREKKEELTDHGSHQTCMPISAHDRLVHAHHSANHHVCCGEGCVAKWGTNCVVLTGAFFESKSRFDID